MTAVKLRTVYSTNEGMRDVQEGRPATLNEHGCAVVLGRDDINGNYLFNVVNHRTGNGGYSVVSRQELELIAAAIAQELRDTEEIKPTLQ